MLLAEGYLVDACTDGAQALERLEAARGAGMPYDLLITDIQMPGLTGDELVDQIKVRSIPCRILAISGFGEKHLVVKLMRKGCHDFLDKPFSDDDLIQAVERVMQMPLPHQTNHNKTELAKVQRKVAELNQYVDSFRDEYKRLMEPGCRHGRFPLEIRFQAHAALGGDLFHAIETDSALRILVADVAGHDPGASFLNYLLKTYFEECRNESPMATYKRTNAALIAQSSQRMITAVQVELDPHSQHMYYYNAGHVPLIRIPADGSPARILHGEGLPLGFFEDQQLVCGAEKVFQGDRIIFCTDGITQLGSRPTTTGDFQELGIHGLADLAMKTRSLPLPAMLDKIWKSALDFANYKPNDDLLLAAVEIT